MSMSLGVKTKLVLRSDTQVVAGKAAADCNGLVVKQVRSAGVPWWEDVVANMKSEHHELN